MFQFIATSTVGLESVVAKELRNLGFSPRNSDFCVGRTFFKGDFSDLIKANLWLRTAGKVLILLAEFEVTDNFDVIFDEVRKIEWEGLAPKDAQFIVEGRSVHSTITSVPALQRTVKKAIVDRLSQRWNLTTLSETGPQYIVEISLYKNKATVTLDTTGRGLHRRGYRVMNVVAPLRETIASALIQLSVWNPERPLIDPFCGSGTIPIEAAMIGRNIAPGLKRTFVSQNWPIIPQKLWEEAREEAYSVILPPIKEKIHGSDTNVEAIKIARQHAVLAGVDKDVFFYERDFLNLEDKRQYGCVICNPPYGTRIDSLENLLNLYQRIPAILAQLPTWSHFIITSWLDFEKVIGQKATRRRKLYNGRLECTFFQFLGPKPVGLSFGRETSSMKLSRANKRNELRAENAVGTTDEKPTRPVNPAQQGSFADVVLPSHILKPVFEGLDAYAEYQARELGRCLTNRARRFRRYPTKGITCYRLYDKDIPEIPLTIEIFEGQWLHITEYERPDGRNAAQHRLWLDKMVTKIAETLKISFGNVFLKKKSRQRGKSQYEKLAESGRIVRVHEGGLTFLCNLTDYLDVGLFLDHRHTRELVRREALGKRFLNLFCYSGTFTCYAADGGASSTVSVDLSPTYLDWGLANLEENNLIIHSNSSDRSFLGKPSLPTENLFIKSDVLRFLRAIPPATGRDPSVVRLIEETAVEIGNVKRQIHCQSCWKRGNRKVYFKKQEENIVRKWQFLPSDVFGVSHSDFELCVCDPPTFSNSKSTVIDWDVQQRHVELLRILATRMKPGGVVFFSNNFRNFKLDEKALVDLYDLKEISKYTIPDDFRNKKIHRCWKMIAK